MLLPHIKKKLRHRSFRLNFEKFFMMHSQVWDKFRQLKSLKMIKKSFYFALKSLFILKVFKVLSWLFGHVEKRLDYKDNVDFEIYDVKTWEVNIAMQILLNISRIKDNQRLKFGQLIQYNMRYTITRKIWWRNYSFSKKSKLGISLD